MPSHIFTRVGKWEQSVDMNLRAIAVARGELSIAEALHASDYATYAYLQTARVLAARRFLVCLSILEAHFDVNAIGSAAPGNAGVFALAAIPARYALERRAWNEAAMLQMKTSDFPWADAVTHFARALGAARTGDTAKVRASIDSLAAGRDRLRASGDVYWMEQVEIQRIGATAWLAFAQGRKADALGAMRQASDREDATEKAAVTPGPLVPARELLGDLLLEYGQPREALEAYRATLQREPRRFRAIYGTMRAASRAGEIAAAVTYAKQLIEVTSVGDTPGRPELVEARRLVRR
jgi:tetratricopeptide (TPR) repeat protein